MPRVATWRSRRPASRIHARVRRSTRNTRDFQITGSIVPANATAVVLNVTATRSQGNGFLQVFPTGQAAVGSSSTLNLDFAGQTIPNAAFAPLGDGGKVTVFTTFTTDVLVDVFGYFVPADTASAGRLVPLTPTRILDTRNSIGYTPPAHRRHSTPPAPPAEPGSEHEELQRLRDLGRGAGLVRHLLPVLRRRRRTRRRRRRHRL